MNRRQDRHQMLAEELPAELFRRPWMYRTAIQLLFVVAKIVAEGPNDNAQKLSATLQALRKIVKLIRELDEDQTENRPERSHTARSADRLYHGMDAV